MNLIVGIVQRIAWTLWVARPIKHREITEGLVPIEGMWLVPSVAERWVEAQRKKQELTGRG